MQKVIHASVANNMRGLMSERERREMPLAILGSGPNARAISRASIERSEPGNGRGPRTEAEDVDRLSARVKELETENGQLRDAISELATIAGDALRKLDAAQTAPKTAAKPKPGSAPSKAQVAAKGGRPSKAEVQRALAAASSWLADRKASRTLTSKSAPRAAAVPSAPIASIPAVHAYAPQACAPMAMAPQASAPVGTFTQAVAAGRPLAITGAGLAAALRHEAAYR